MQSPQLDSSDEVSLMKLLNKIHVQEAQLKLLQETMKDNDLLNSRILSSIQPKIGREFIDNELENKKLDILRNARKQHLSLAVKEKETVLSQMNIEFNTKKEDHLTNSANPNELLGKLEQASAKQCCEINEKMNNKVDFHLQGSHERIKFTKIRNYIRKKKRKPNARQKKKKKKAIYLNKKKQKKQENIKKWLIRLKKRI